MSRRDLRELRRDHVRRAVLHALECREAHLPGLRIYTIETCSGTSSVFEHEIVEAVAELQETGCVLPVCITVMLA